MVKCVEVGVFGELVGETVGLGAVLVEGGGVTGEWVLRTTGGPLGGAGAELVGGAVTSKQVEDSSDSSMSGVRSKMVGEGFGAGVWWGFSKCVKT